MLNLFEPSGIKPRYLSLVIKGHYLKPQKYNIDISWNF